MNPCPATIPALLRMTSERHPHDSACFHRLNRKWVPTTWSQVRSGVERIAQGFARLGLEKGDRLAILSHSRQEWFMAEMAGLQAGAVVVGIDPFTGGEQLPLMFKHSGACALIVDSKKTLSLLPNALCDRLKFIILFDESTSDRNATGAPQLSWATFTAERKNERCEILNFPNADDPAALIYSSGSTGEPKGILYSHRQLMAACQSIVETFPEMNAKGTALCWLPMAHLYQRMMNFAAMAHGMATYFLENPREVAATLREVDPTLIIGVPRFYEKMRESIYERLEESPGWQKRLFCAAFSAGAGMARCKRKGVEPSRWLHIKYAVLDALVLRKIRMAVGRSLKFMVTGSAPATPAILEFFHSIGLLVLEAYGLSENAVPMAINRPEAFRFGSVGKPLTTNEIRIQMDGEILVRGPGVFSGYVGESATENQFTSDGFYRTGDCGYFDTDGYLYLTGRKSEIIKTSTGRRIAPAQVEAVYRQSRYIDQVVVVGNGRKHLTGLVTLNSDILQKDLRWAWEWPDFREETICSPPLRAIIELELKRCGRSLAPYERIQDFVILSEPFTVANGALTASLKLRRGWIESHYRDLIEQLYDKDYRQVQSASLHQDALS